MHIAIASNSNRKYNTRNTMNGTKGRILDNYTIVTNESLYCSAIKNT